MNKKFIQKLDVEVISPMFSCGNKGEKNKRIPEIRTSEVKGLMRYIYRVANIEKEYIKLLEKEGEIFGKSEERASPIRIQISGNIGQLKEDYLRYYYEGTENKSIPIGTKLTITIRCFQKNTTYTLENFRDMLELSLLLGGIGRRARRGRGCMATQFARSKNIEELKEWIANKLNFINMHEEKDITADEKFRYNLQGNVIYGPECFQEQSYLRPVIEKIVFGKKLNIQYMSIKKEKLIERFLRAVDDASHNIKKDNDKIIFATGHISRKNGARHNFSSSVIVTLVEAKDGIYPVFVFLKAIYGGEEIENYKDEQYEFVNLINRRSEVR